ncbi:MAG: hypothetical protein ABI837_18275 [Acidobacteriota bacterium]
MSVRSRIGILLALAAWPAIAQNTDLPPMTTVVIPVVGSVLGANGVRWKTDLELRNDGPAEATVSLVLPTAPDQPAMITTIAGGDTVRFSDVVGQAFGMESALSPLLVQTLGRRSVSIHASAYGVRGSEALRPEPITFSYNSPFYPIRTLYGLSFSDSYRTNVGIANLGETEAPVTLALQRIPGRYLAISRLVVPPNTLWHVPIQALFPLISDGDDFSILIETSSTATYVYASVIENATSTAKFVQPSLGSPASAP